MTYTYFLSYAKDDLDEFGGRDEFLKDFFNDLRKALSRISGVSPAQVGFRDRRMPSGANWERALTAALRSVKVFIPIYSPKYFMSDFCGKEWYAFSLRMSAGEAAGGQFADAILPVWWIPPRVLPTVAAATNDTRHQFGYKYGRSGLRSLAQRKGSSHRYSDFINRFAERVLAATENPPPVGDFGSVTALPNAFDLADPLAGPAVRPRVTIGGPCHVKFLVAARGRDEMRSVREAIDGSEVYGADWASWKPYHPACELPVVARAQTVVGKRGLISEPAPVDTSLPGVLAEVERLNRVAVLLVDRWALRLPECATVLSAFNRTRSAHAAVLVPWDTAEPAPPKDDENDDHLMANLGLWLEQGSPVFQHRVDSPERFSKKLIAAVRASQDRIMKQARVIRRLNGGPDELPMFGL